MGFHPTGVDVAASATLRVDLRLSPDELLLCMSKHTRRDFKQSLRGPTSVRFATRAELGSFHELYCATAARHGFTPWSLRYIESVWDELSPTGQVAVVLADVDGTDVAGNMATCFGDIATGRLVGFDPSRLTARIRPNEALQWALMEWGRTRGLHWLDVGGVRRDDALALARNDGPVGDQQTLKMRLPGTPIIYPEPLQLIGNPMLRIAYRTLGSRKSLHTLRTLVQRRLRQGSNVNGQWL
jgi:lipid II:glycine glycyltransferase (peptidoglycan interpeptide bridge formation enzyme)